MNNTRNLLFTTLLVLVLSSNSNSKVTTDNEMLIENQQYICNELSSIKAALDNSYCSSSSDMSIQQDCESITATQNSCKAEWRGKSIALIFLGERKELKAELNSEFQFDTEKSVNDLMKFKPEADLISDTQEKGTPPSLTVKCINTISNKWYCGIKSSSYKHTTLSKENTEKRQILFSELFDKASSCISKL